MLKSLNVAQTGLSAAKIAVENVSNNIANENTPGYKKRVVQLNELNLGDSRFTGSGVRADDAYRITSEYMFNNIMKENTKNSYYDEISSIVGNVEQMFQETDTSGFSNDLDRFFQAVENLRSTPNSELYKTTLKTTGNNLVDSLQNLYENIEQQESITYNRLEDNVQEINAILNDIGELNEQMGLSNNSTNSLLDKRDQLEKELSTLVDIDVSRDSDDYQLKIGGAIAVRYNTNIREVNLVEDNTTQIDRFATEDSNGFAIDSIANGRTLDAGDVITYKFDNTHEVSVTIGDYVYDAHGDAISLDGDATPDIVDDTNFIRALKYEINHNTYISEKVNAYNGNYQVDENGEKIDTEDSDKFLVIESTVDGTEGAFNGRISINDVTSSETYEYVSFNGDVDILEFPAGTQISNVDATSKVELDALVDGVNVTYDATTDTYTFQNADSIDFDGIPNNNVQLNLRYDLADDPAQPIRFHVGANGATIKNLDDESDNTLKANIGSLISTTQHELVSEDEIFLDTSSEIFLSSTNIDFEGNSEGNTTIFKDDYQSVDAENKVYLAVYDSEVDVSSGVIKAQIENLTTTSANNKIVDYKEKLDVLAATISDIYGKYVVKSDDSYTYGHISTDSFNGTETVENLGLFSGSSVKSLVFNEAMVNDLNQDDLDYISSMQWKDDIDFDGFAQDGSTQEKTSFSEYFQEVRVNISTDKENNDFLMETQTAVVQSLEASYEQLTKVDSDEEMINLIQFQAAYTANAKIITVVDEMLQTLLGIR